jgi:ABC-2 type transport system ATP-binding protein
MKYIAIEISQISKHYRSQAAGALALDNLSFQVQTGGLFGLVGPDGAGKTSLMRILATAILPTSGSAAICGLDVVKQAELIHPLIGYMPQNFSLYPDLTVQENLTFFANINQVHAADQTQRFAQLLAFTNLEKYRDRRSQNLSGGMRKKLALACALVHQPQVLLLDEPTTGVDPISRREFWTILSELALSGVTIFISTPYMDEAERCQHIGMIQKGHLLKISEPRILTAELPYEILELIMPRLEEAQELIDPLKEVGSSRIVGDRMRIQAAHVKPAAAAVEKTLKSADLGSYHLRRVQKTMEDVFLEMTGDTHE